MLTAWSCRFRAARCIRGSEAYRAHWREWHARHTSPFALGAGRRGDARYVAAGSANARAEIPGRELPEERVVIGGHYDAQLEGAGAADNLTGSATLLEIAQRRADLEPRRTSVLCAFDVEELAFWGACHYCRGHVDELDRTRGL